MVSTPSPQDAASAVLQAARLAFASRGYAHTTMKSVAAAAGVAPKDIRIGGARFDDLHRSGWDPSARVADQDRDGVGAEIIYPTDGLVVARDPDLPPERPDASDRRCAVHRGVAVALPRVLSGVLAGRIRRSARVHSGPL